MNQGEQVFIKDGELGDANNLYIGGVDSLYRMLSYSGEYHDDVREGNGIMTYANGDTVDGNFLFGLPHGTMVYTFCKTGKTRVAKYRNGYRLGWTEVKRSSISRSFFSSGISRSSSRDNTMGKGRVPGITLSKKH
jgi:hypothetical protein